MTPRSISEPAVAVFRQRREFVEPDHCEAGVCERLDQRIGQPLRELVERHDLVGIVAHGRMTAGVAERIAVQRQAGWPDRRQPVEQRRKDRRSWKAPVGGGPQEMIDEMAGPRGCAAEQVGPGRERLAELAQQQASPLQSDQRIAGIDVEVPRQCLGVDPGQSVAVGAPRLPRIAGKSAVAEHMDARDRKPFGAREAQVAVALAIVPLDAGAGVEQHAHGREIDGDARAFDRIGRQPLRQPGPAVDVARGEVPPAAVRGNFQIGIGLARDFRDVGRDLLELIVRQRKMRRAAVRDPVVDHAAALAHRRGGQELGEVRRRVVVQGWRAHARHSPSLRPTVPAKSRLI